MALDKADREKAAFARHLGLFLFRVMLLSLANNPSVFQQLMSLNEIEDFAMVYLDDILVFSETPEQHFDHLRQVLG